MEKGWGGDGGDIMHFKICPFWPSMFLFLYVLSAISVETDLLMIMCIAGKKYAACWFLLHILIW